MFEIQAVTDAPQYKALHRAFTISLRLNQWHATRPRWYAVHRHLTNLILPTRRREYALLNTQLAAMLDELEQQARIHT